MKCMKSLKKKTINPQVAASNGYTVEVFSPKRIYPKVNKFYFLQNKKKLPISQRLGILCLP